jgi:8-oxo-dGTP pyrophosphatase MutT (NUDIX family)
VQKADVPAGGADQPAHATWPGWERDLGLVGAYKNLIGQAFHDAETRGSELRKKAATGAMFVSNPVLRDLISDEVREVFSGVLTPLWTEAWHLGYAAAKSLATGQPADFSAKGEDSEALAGFIGSEGEHWLQQIAKTGLGNNAARSELIARTEVGRAINSAAIQCYRDHGVTHKHLLTAPGACDMCMDAADDGVIPLDAPFSSGGILGLSHPGDRCCPAPSWIDVEPPFAHLGKSAPWADLAPVGPILHTAGCGCIKSAATEDESRLVWLLLRARDEDGKWRFLLQQRSDGSWGMPGGKPHLGEDAWGAAVREVTEEIGAFPSPRITATFHHVEDDGQTQVYLWLCDVPYFHPVLDGETPDETSGVAWFRRKEIAGLDLAPKFREDWETGISLKEHVTKALQRVVDEQGQVLTLDKPAQRLQAAGARWPYPRRSDGAEDANGSLTWPNAGPGAVPSDVGSAGGEPPNLINDGAQAEPHGDHAPRGGDDGRMPGRRKPNPPATEFPDQGQEDQDAWPYPQTTLTPGASPVGANTGVPPSGAAKNDSGHPVVGAYEPEAPKPMRPHATPPESFNPGETVEQWSPQDDSDVVHTLPGAKKGAQHVTDPNPVEWRHVYAQLEANFPPEAIEWVKRARWIGPVNIPWSRIDDDDIGSWAASHQPDAVNRFARAISSGNGNTAPSVLVQEPGKNKAFIVDGHHRALARRKLGKPVLAYVGNINPRDREAAEQTHSSQFHSGSDPANKGGDAETLREYWTHEAHGGPTHFAYAEQIQWGTPGDFDRCTALVMEHGKMSEEQAHGYCNLRHHEALGYWPAQHAQMDKGSD